MTRGVLSDRTVSRWGRRLPWLCMARFLWHFLLLQWIVPRFSADPVANGGVVLVLRGDWDFIVFFYTVVNLLYALTQN